MRRGSFAHDLHIYRRKPPHGRAHDRPHDGPQEGNCTRDAGDRAGPEAPRGRRGQSALKCLRKRDACHARAVDMSIQAQSPRQLTEMLCHVPVTEIRRRRGDVPYVGARFA